MRFSTPPSLWPETLLFFQPRTLNGSRSLGPLLFPCRMLTCEPRVSVMAFWIRSRVLSRARGRSPPGRAGRPAPAPEPEAAPVGRPAPPRPLLPPRPPGASMSMSPSRSVRIGPRLRMPPRSPPERRDFMVFMVRRGERGTIGDGRNGGVGGEEQRIDAGLSGPFVKATARCAPQIEKEDLIRMQDSRSSCGRVRRERGKSQRCRDEY